MTYLPNSINHYRQRLGLSAHYCTVGRPCLALALDSEIRVLLVKPQPIITNRQDEVEGQELFTYCAIDAIKALPSDLATNVTLLEDIVFNLKSNSEPNVATAFCL